MPEDSDARVEEVLGAAPVAEAVGCTKWENRSRCGMKAHGSWAGVGEQAVSARGRRSGFAPRGAPQRGILKLRGWVRRCPRRQGYIRLPPKLTWSLRGR